MPDTPRNYYTCAAMCSPHRHGRDSVKKTQNKQNFYLIFYYKKKRNCWETLHNTHMHVKDRKNKNKQKCSLKREEKDDSEQTLLNCSLLVFITTSVKVQLRRAEQSGSTSVTAFPRQRRIHRFSSHCAQTQTHLLFQERYYNLDPNLHLLVPLSVD